ncbi:hypothetical protein SAMN04488693_1295 [Arthrobacter subterraneus]|uniref:Uncharacterized protein n=1 Tax=Arthrobacter subterraneus TaxID=335973 RepID=A0A1G8P3U0_9MICC|nr:hypothetical protein [Arthrobacter subterraneus]SDI87117.1 hypothetical protein SAMN04488693_1295 [Arthrobacter subterraneus]
MTLSPAIWESLVAETQFAAELTLTGLRRLCSVPAEFELAPWYGKDLNYALHVGMHSYSSGLERLCKLAIACNNYATTGEFPNLRKYSHKIGDLLDAVEELTPPPSSPGTAERKKKHLSRPSDPLDPDLTKTIERFANGAGRYEHLDSLWNDSAEVNTYNEWSALAARVSLPEEVRRLISLKEASAYAMGAELSEVGLESTAASVMEDLTTPTYEPSVGVVLSLHRQARWVATSLDIATYYTTQDLPLLGEVVSSTFIHTSADFFNYHIARLSDDVTIEEELHVAFERIRAREEEPDDDDVDCGNPN